MMIATPTPHAACPTPPAPRPRLLGVNLCGAEFGETHLPGQYGLHYVYPRAESLPYYRDKGLTLIRLPFRWERMQPSLEGPLAAEELARMDRFIAAADKLGMRVIPSPHNFARYIGRLIGTPDVPAGAFAEFWSKFADHYRGEQAVWAVGLMNEPHDTGGLWPAAAQLATDAVRAADPDRWVLVPGDHWAGVAEWRKYNEDLAVHDVGRRVMYEGHLYFDHDNSGTYVKGYDAEGAWADVGAERLRNFIEWLAERDAAGFIGEFGAPADDVRWLDVLDRFLGRLRELNLSACYWAGGPWWKNYRLSIEPQSGEDKPQTKVLERYAPASAAP